MPHVMPIFESDQSSNDPVGLYKNVLIMSMHIYCPPTHMYIEEVAGAKLYCISSLFGLNCPLYEYIQVMMQSKHS